MGRVFLIMRCEVLDRLAHTLNIQTFQLFDPSTTPEGALLNIVNLRKRSQRITRIITNKYGFRLKYSCSFVSFVDKNP